MATADKWSSADLKGIADGGLINEDVMQKIWDISNVPLPFSDMIQTQGASNSYTEWTTDELATPTKTNKVVDGADAAANANDAKGGARIGNHCQISTKIVRVSHRANKSDSIGRAQELGYQVGERQKELRRDVECALLSNNESVADNGDSIAGQSAGLAAFLTTHTDRGGSGADGGFTGGSVGAPTEGTSRALSFATLQDVCGEIWEAGADPTVIMSIPKVIRNLSRFMFTDTAQIATLTSETTQSREQSVAKGAVNVLVTDYGVTLEMKPNRIQQPSNATGGQERADLFVIDPNYLAIGMLEGYRVDELGKTGLSDSREMSVDWCLKVLNEKAHGVIADIDYTQAVVG